MGALNLWNNMVRYQRTAENTKQRKHRRRKHTKSKKGLSHRDAFRPCSRVSSGDRISRETSWKTNYYNKGIPKEIAAQPSGCFRVFFSSSSFSGSIPSWTLYLSSFCVYAVLCSLPLFGISQLDLYPGAADGCAATSFGMPLL